MIAQCTAVLVVLWVNLDISITGPPALLSNQTGRKGGPSAATILDDRCAADFDSVTRDSVSEHR